MNFGPGRIYPYPWTRDWHSGRGAPRGLDTSSSEPCVWGWRSLRLFVSTVSSGVDIGSRREFGLGLGELRLGPALQSSGPSL